MENLLLNIGAAYIRVSDERQDEYSPASQLSKIREYAAKEGYQIPDEYVYYDDGISGRSTRGRDEFKRMVNDAVGKEHPFNVLYVWKLSRFSRNMEDSIIYTSMLEKKGVNVVSVSEPISRDIYGKLTKRFLEWEAQFYSERLSDDVKRGLEEKIARREPITPPPYGYIMGEKQYVPDEESGAADVVREVFRRYAAGEKQREIAISLGERGVRTKQGNLPENRWVDYMLQNPTYIGKLRFSQGARHISKRDYDNEDILVVDGTHVPLVSQELWEDVQERLRRQKLAYGRRARTEKPAQFMLKGLIRCSACGSTLCMGVKHGKKGISSLQCHSYSRGQCTVSHSITVPKAEAAFVQGLRDAVAQKRFSVLPKKAKPQKDGVDYNKLIAVEERKLSRAKEAYLAEIDTLAQYSAAKQAIEAKIAELRDMQEKSENENAAELDTSRFAQKVLEILAFIERPDVTPEAKNAAIRTIVEKIVFEKAKGNLAIYFHDIL